ncbi:hypothetical protein A3J78_02170 [Candidatus Beckwithbacteria bacterium RBG_13_35_6]|uniref:Uncharacterized protein n=1 Tax=Candidatus Beckwithbacteria bacterium RBG_13_35_6 TaxID=1797456 RepID=A0A1F5DH95_9BACT|nr:MAG: hypothetical protein A3J78_02170 [Candidatus Beckwithbacteria bacterium RBG_13_35_6]
MVEELGDGSFAGKGKLDAGRLGLANIFADADGVKTPDAKLGDGDGTDINLFCTNQNPKAPADKSSKLTTIVAATTRKVLLDFCFGELASILPPFYKVTKKFYFLTNK